MPGTRVFNKSVFDSYANLQKFFRESDAIDQVLSRKDKPYSKKLIPLNPNLHWKWQACQIATAPFRIILYVPLILVHKLASTLGKYGSFEAALQIAKTARMGAKYLAAGFKTYSEAPTNLYRIKNTINEPNAEGKIVSETPSIPNEQITDSKVQKRTRGNGIKFDNNNGICFGECLWYLHLYLKTKDQFTDPRAQMAAIGKQFAKGGGMDPTLIQSLHLGKGKLLGIKMGSQAPRELGVWDLSKLNFNGTVIAKQISNYGTPVILRTPTEWRSLGDEIIRQLQTLPSGAYTARMPGHVTVYVKIHDRLGYFFDPNDGITEIQGDSVGEELYKQVLDTTGRLLTIPSVQASIKTDYGTYTSPIAISPVKLR